MYAGFDEITKTFNKNVQLANTKSKSLVAKKAINTAKTAAQMKQNAVTSTLAPPGNEGFVTYNELYNVHNSLLPCKVEYPYKNSGSAQANDNLVYMKKYA